jgi:hypothetical protein
MNEMPRKSIRRVRPMANAPEPEGPLGGMSNSPSCGHGGCGVECNVRYCGPTSHMRDHHIMHAAKGASQVWMAAIVAGLAVVLTGAVAFSSVEAQVKAGAANARPAAPATVSIESRLDRISAKLDQLERKIDGIAERVSGGRPIPSGLQGGSLPEGMPNDKVGTVKKGAAGDEAAAKLKATQCRAECNAKRLACVQAMEASTPGADADLRCAPTLTDCLASCAAM